MWKVLIIFINIYNQYTGGCYDGLEKFKVNLNQGAESTVSYLMARIVIEKYARVLLPLPEAQAKIEFV